ncbi:hypothetical protein DAI22_11g202400 [Oryza sativa Japonica Group]|nr:hypothetical protein DAI22_11g202400 [Oryza sativa Japonica Group]
MSNLARYHTFRHGRLVGFWYIMFLHLASCVVPRRFMTCVVAIAIGRCTKLKLLGKLSF